VEEVQQLQALMRGAANMEFHVHVSSSEGRLDAEEEVRGFVGPKEGARQGRVWVYVSGPEGLLAGVETACVKEEKELSRGERSGGMVSGMEWYVARWSL